MIFDLAQHDGDVSLATDVLIIGGGIAGLLLAASLRHRKIRVVVIESGERTQVEDTHPLNHVVQRGDIYRGAMHGRFRCLGGTSTRWGGAMIPFLRHDFAARPYVDVPAWPVGIEEVSPYLGEVEALFGLDYGSYEEEFIRGFEHGKIVPTGDADFVARFAKWPVFKRRNVATLLENQIECDPDFCVWLNSTAVHFELEEGLARLRSVTARHASGRTITIGASHVVLCAGAIESTRLLLLLDAQYDDRVFNHCGALGRYFHDHISAPAAVINTSEPNRLNRLAGFRFTGTTMRSLRFELSPEAQCRTGAASAFGHISFQAAGNSGIHALRDMLRSLQRNGRFDFSAAPAVLNDFPYLVRTAVWRYARKQLYWPSPAEYALHVVAEQIPRAVNRITLASDKDLFGLPLASIDWRVTREDRRAFGIYRELFDSFWRRHRLDGMGSLEWSIPVDTAECDSIAEAGDVYHPGGSTRMGTDRCDAVVDSNLQVFAISNLWVSSTSVFPSGASANPTLMLMLFTHRLAEHLAKLREYGNW